MDAIVQNRIEIRLFGAMEVLGPDGRSLLPPLRKTQAILAILALAGSKAISREQFVSMLWSRRDRDHAHASLRQCVYQLRDVLQPLGVGLLRAERTALALDPSQIWVDALSLLRAQGPRPEVVELVRGPLLQDLYGLDPAFDRWLESERQRVTTAALVIAEQLLATETDPLGLITAAERLLRIDQTHERSWRALMAGHARLGNIAAASQAYERCAVILAQNAGLMPSAETVALLDQIREGRAEWATDPPARVVPSARMSSVETSSNGLVPPARGTFARLGVMPLRPLNQGSEELAAGLAEEITTALSQFRCMVCILPASLAPSGSEMEQLAAQDVDFLFEGSVQVSQNRTLVMVRLRDAHCGGQVVWSQRFQRDMPDMVVLQSEIAAQTAAQLNSELIIRECRRLEASPPPDPTSSQLLLRGIRAIFRLEKNAFLSAGELLAAAVAREPDHAAAYAWWAYWHVTLIGQGWAPDVEAATARTWELTKQAIALDPYDPHALTLTGHVRAFAHHRLDDGMALHDKALSINPNLPLAWLFSGLTCAWSGLHQEAIRRIQHGKLLSPLDPHGFFFDMALTLCHLLTGETGPAVSAGHSATLANPEFSASFKALLAVLGYSRSAGSDTNILNRLLTLEPGFTVSEALARSPLQLREDRVRFADGLLRAGLPK